MPDYDLPKVSQLLGISVYDFSSENLGSPFPNYHKKVCFANIEVHFSTTHSNALINLSGQACRQYEEYMNKGEGWQWQKFLKTIIELNGKITRIDLALDIFDDLSPSVKTIQDYIKRGQLSTKAHKFVEINSGRISDGVLTGFTIYIGSAPQILRIYDKANERLVNADEIIIGKWIRWELELTDKKAQQVAVLIGEGKPLGYVIRGILAAHYSFKTQNKKIEIHNKSRLPNILIIPDPIATARENWNKVVTVCNQKIACVGEFICFFHFDETEKVILVSSLTLPEYDHVKRGIEIR